MGIFDILRGEITYSRSSLSTTDKDKSCQIALERLDELGYTSGSLQLTESGKSFTAFYLSRFTEDSVLVDELVEIIERSVEEQPAGSSFSQVDYVLGFCSGIVRNDFIDLPFDDEISEGKEIVEAMLKAKKMTFFQFRVMVALYFLGLAEERGIVRREDNGVLYRA